MAFDVNNPYFRTKVLTASPEQLRLMLLEGCLHFLDEGIEGLRVQNFERVYEGFTQAKAILMELMDGLRPQHAPELCKNLAAIYTFVYRLIMEASLEKNADKAQEARRLMEYERETWAMLIERLASEGADQAEARTEDAPPAADRAAPAPASAPKVSTGTYGPPPARSGLSLQG